MSLVFDHSRKTLTECMGMEESHLLELSKKLAAITKDFIIIDEMKKSQVAERLALELSYSDLIFVATGKVLESADNAMRHHKEMMTQIEELMGKLEDKFGKIEQEDDDDDQDS